MEFLTLRDVQERGHVAPGPAGRNTLHIRSTASSPRGGDAEWTVSVAYYRAGYGPGDYPTEAEWEARRLIEHSNAVKCPNAGYQLAGTKAIQASLCLPGVLERYVTAEEAAQLRGCFAAQFSLVALAGITTDALSPPSPLTQRPSVLQTRRRRALRTERPHRRPCARPPRTAGPGCSSPSEREAATTCTAPSSAPF